MLGAKMTPTYLTEIYRGENTACRRLAHVVCLSVDAIGSIHLFATDASTNGGDLWGDDNEEFCIDVPVTELRKLAFALIREKYSGRADAVDEFSGFCAREKIEYKFDHHYCRI
jgi:hypothetical protein